MSFLEELTGYSGRLKIGDVTVDCSRAETHALEADATEHEVEEGSDITDHYRARPRTIQIAGTITDSPISTGLPGATLVNSVVSLAKGSDPVGDAWRVIKGYFSDGELVTIETSFDSYQNIALLGFSVERAASFGRAMNFTLDARQLRIVTTLDAAAIPIPKTDTAKKATKAANKGNKQTAAANEAQSQSAAKQLLGKLGSIF